MGEKIVYLKFKYYFCTAFGENAEIAQLVEHNLAKVGVASSSLVFRSDCSNGGIGRHEGLKIPWPGMAVRVQVPLRVLRKASRREALLFVGIIMGQELVNNVFSQ